MSSSLKAFNLLGLLIFTCALDGITGGFNWTGGKSLKYIQHISDAPIPIPVSVSVLFLAISVCIGKATNA